MKMKLLALAAFLVAGPFVLMGASYINSTVAICDPLVPANCLAPSATGGIAQAPTAGAMVVTAPSVGVASAQALAAGTRKYLFIQNESATASIACRADGGTAALNAAGSFMLLPLASRTWEGSATPTAAITCIATAAATPATIESL